MLISFNNVDYEYLVRESWFKFNRIKALSGISFDIYEGESLGIVGRNGAGKTTLLRLLGGILEPTRGTLERRNRINVSILTLQLGFLEDLTGRENAFLGAKRLSKGNRLKDEILHEIAELSQLHEWMDEPVKYYSSGMRARLAFSVAYQMAPDLLIVDEALGVGDQAFRDTSTHLMKQKIKSEQTVVFVSHNPHTTRELCNKVLWLENGKMKAFGDANCVLDQYMESFRK